MPVMEASPKVQTAYEKLLEMVRGQPAGMPLPSVSALRQDFGASQLTVQRAYDVLERQGWIDRQPGKGVFVADPVASGEVAIVLKPSQLEMGASHYYAAASQHIINLIQSRSSKLRGRIHTGGPILDPYEHAKSLDLLEPQVRDRLRGVFTLQPLFEVGEQLQEAGIPVVSLAARAQCPSVLADRQTGMTMAVHEARRRGAEKIAWVSMPGPVRAHDDLKFTATETGFRVQPPWAMVDSHGAEYAGYEAMQAIWGREDKPEALIITDDVLCNGVLRAMLQLGIEPPEDAGLITFANQGVPLHYHKPVTRVEIDWRKQCQQAVELMLKLAAQPDQVSDDTENEPILISPSFVEGETL